jgi:hypothetical protein
MPLTKSIYRKIDSYGKKWTVMFNPMAMRPRTKSNSLQPGCGVVKVFDGDGTQHEWRFDAGGWLEDAPKHWLDKEAALVVQYVINEAMMGK